MIKRNSYLISRAFNNYLWAALISSACMQMTVMVDAIIAGHVIGPVALTAINLSMPLTTLIIAVSTLICIGPSIMAAKAIGSRNTGEVNAIFSSAIYQAISIGGVLGIALYILLPQIGRRLCSNEELLPYVMDYISVLPFTLVFMMLSLTLVNLVEADGLPKFATKAVVLGSLLNMVLDVVLVKFLDFGIRGIALAMLANYLLVTLYFICTMKRNGVSYRWSSPDRDIIHASFDGLKEGMPMIVNDLLYSLMLFCVNTLLLTFYSEHELYFWTIFLQYTLFIMVVVDCAEGAVLSIGSLLEGENDKFGLRALVRRIWMLVGGIALFIMVVIWLFPVQTALIFGNYDTISEDWPKAARILSLMLVPYTLSTFMRSVFQVLGNRTVGIFFSFGQFTLTVAGLYVAAHWAPQQLWWSFPIATWTLFAIQCIYILIVRNRKQIKAFSMIQLNEDKNFLDLSVAYDQESVTTAIQHVCKFLQNQGVDQQIEMEVNICCEELMTNIVNFQTRKSRSFMDVSISVEEHRVLLALKDSGRPFNPVLTTCIPEMLKDEEVSLGLFLANRVCTNLSHRYMYGLNVVFAEFDMQKSNNK